jgi:hypothetical protein
LITNQINARPGPDIALINVVRRTFWPPRRSDHYSVSLLDFKKLKPALAEAGMIDHNAKWKRPSFEQEHESLHAGLDETEKMLDRKGREEYLAAFRKRLQEKQQGVSRKT